MARTFAARALWQTLTAGCLLLIGCGPSERVGLATGKFTLVAFNGQSLPVDQGALPVRCPPVPTNPPCDPHRSQPCHQVLTEGTLSLDEARGRYDIFYLTRSSCGAYVLSLSDQTGVYRPEGGAVTFRGDGNHASPEFARFSGIVKGDSAVVDWYSDSHLQLHRAGEPTAPVLGGQFALVERRDRNLTVAGALAPPAVCPAAIKDGSLTLVPTPELAPRTGRFRLYQELADSCRDGPAQRREELGTYEQVVNTLVFVAELGPNVVHRFHGSIADAEVALHVSGESDLIFRR